MFASVPKKLTRFLTLAHTDRVLLCESVVELARARRLLATTPFRKIASQLGERDKSRICHDRPSSTPERVKRAIEIAVRNVPWKAECLVQAIAASRMLRRRKMAGTVYFGLAKNRQQGFEAHAWLQSGKVIVTGAFGHESFSIVETFTF